MTQANLLESAAFPRPTFWAPHTRRVEQLAWPIGARVGNMTVPRSFPGSPSFPSSSIPIQNLQCRNQQLFGRKLRLGPSSSRAGRLGGVKKHSVTEIWHLKGFPAHPLPEGVDGNHRGLPRAPADNIPQKITAQWFKDPPPNPALFFK